MTPSPSKPRARRFGRSTVAIVAGLAAGLAAVVPLPYFIIAPGHAIDLRTRITIEGRAASSAGFFLTDVTVARATALGLAAQLLPATSIVPLGDVMPAGQSSAAFDRSMTDAMTESQTIASFVAERAAGYRVPADFIVRVEGFPPTTRARPALQRGDVIETVAGRRVRGTADIAAAIAAAKPAAVRVAIERDGKPHTVLVRTIAGPGRAKKLGIYVSSRLPAVDLPVPVRFAMDDVSGASGGLMFALQIYAELRPFETSSHAVAGTGTISPDGKVGAIEGTRQKLEAAKRAGATVFFVPLANAHEIEGTKTTGIAIVPVATFTSAVNYLREN